MNGKHVFPETVGNGILIPTKSYFSGAVVGDGMGGSGGTSISVFLFMN
jgi:tetrahydromethanopterin S-methyltransferase subunit D